MPFAPLVPRPSRRTTLALASTALSLTIAAGVAIAAGGIDVSSWQHSRHHRTIAWSKVKADGQSFVFIKASEGTSYVNPYYPGDWATTRTIGLYHGAYHFARPSSRHGSAAAQARHFAAVVGNQHQPGALPPVLDLEVTGGLRPHRLISWVHGWLTATKRLTHRTPMIYTYPYFWRHDMANTQRFRHYRLWVANYSVSHPQLFGGWHTWTFWQYSSRGRVAGIGGGKVDMNQFSGTPSQLRAMALGGLPVPTPTPTPTPTGTTPTSTPSPAPSGTVTGSAAPTATDAPSGWTLPPPPPRVPPGG